ncbi:putative NRPS-like protein biosynthetic cluster [Steccherinum ochraceum]|uniref:Putative NRPS-like protein biosynthetic cluster n=1 Tax=Steccherinum ochraceum TaxID=92696 RepID=A0A4R0RCH5_9APHY|nr:putative NRPS-like protein biosynthetic cluster [Steccherinum ochraceum]
MNPDEHIVLPIPQAPARVQADTPSTTFKEPPLDGSLTIPDLWDWHLKHSPDHPLFHYADTDATVKTLCWAEATRAMHAAGQLINSRLKQHGSRQTMAILAAGDYITFLLVLMGMLRLGHNVFIVSPRNSPAAVAHLLVEIGVTHLVVGPEEGIRNSSQIALTELADKGLNVPEVSVMPTPDEIFNLSTASDFSFLPPVQMKLSDPAIVLHTSGSTSFPKPVPMNHHRLLLWGISGKFCAVNITGLRLSTHAVPMFHAMGLIPTVWAATVGLELNAFRPQIPSPSITATTALEACIATKSDRMLSVATFIEEWSRDPESVDKLKLLQGVMFGGAPLAKDVGDYLVSQGVGVHNVYGVAECGALSMCFPPAGPPEVDWEYLRVNDGVRVKWVADEAGEMFQPFIVPNVYAVPNVFNSTIDGEPAFAISDWVARHPTKPDYFKILDRVDNQIIHSTGEKTNPSPLESILNQDPRVRSSLMFGRGKFNAGILVDPRPEYAFDPVDEAKLVQFRNDIWSTVEKMNAYAPQHSRVFKEMILVACPSKPIEYTSKLTPRRGATINAYAKEIEAIYASVESSTQADLAPPATWDEKSTLEFVRALVNKVLKNPASDTEDIFQRGCDSLQATWIRNSILHALRNASSVDVRKIPTNFVYEHATIGGLAKFLSAHASNDLVVPSTEDKVAAMLAMVDKYTASFPKHVASVPTPSKDTVLVTGTTGGLGASLLANLVQSDDVIKVFVLNRRSSQPLVSRQKTVLEERGYSASLVDHEKVGLLEADLSRPDFGLDSVVLAEVSRIWAPQSSEDELKTYGTQIRSSVTHIMHIAYRVNWSLSLRSFDADVHAVRNFVDLALSSPHQTPPRILMTSSIAVVAGIQSSSPIKEEPVAPEVAVDNGYSESKWVCERILETCASKTPMRPIVVRVGQITGSPSGAWNTSEWFPSLVRSSVYLGALPELEEGLTVSWIPADSAARALLDLRGASSDSESAFFHLAHPRPVSIKTILDVASKHLQLIRIPLAEWVDRLKKSAEAFGEGSEQEMTKINPGLRLVGMYEAAITATSTEAFGVPVLDTVNAETAAKSLTKGELKDLGAEDVASWLGYWKRVAFL